MYISLTGGGGKYREYWLISLLIWSYNVETHKLQNTYKSLCFRIKFTGQSTSNFAARQLLWFAQRYQSTVDFLLVIVVVYYGKTSQRSKWFIRPVATNHHEPNLWWLTRLNYNLVGVRRNHHRDIFPAVASKSIRHVELGNVFEAGR